MKWLIVYSDGSEFSSDDGAPWEAPVGGVQVVFNEEATVGFRVEQSPHGYWGWDPEQGWVGFRTMSGYWDYLFRTGIMKYVLFGRVLSNADWARTYKDAGERAMGRVKSGWWGARELEEGVPNEP